MMHATDGITLAAAFVAGFAGSAHCFAMCGAMAGALAMRSRGSRCAPARSSLHHVGRIGSYALLGAIGGGFGQSVTWITSLVRMDALLRTGAGVITLLIAWRVWSGRNPLAAVERAGAHFWQRLRPLTRFAAQSNHWGSQLLMGMVWGWLPCGLVYSVLLMTLTTHSAPAGAAIMLAFGLGTAPALLASTLLTAKVSGPWQHRSWRTAHGLLLAAFGCWMMAAAWIPMPHLHAVS